MMTPEDLHYIKPCYTWKSCKSKEDSIRHIPILVELDPIIFPIYEDPIIPKCITKPIALAPRYYIKIKYPDSYNSSSAISSYPYIFNIDKYGTLANIIQLHLLPSIGTDLNSCYKIEYWQWVKVLKPLTRRTDIDTDITHKFIKHEYWHIPNNRRRDPCRDNSIELIRKDDDTLLCPDNIDRFPDDKTKEIFSIESISTEEGDWILALTEMNAPIRVITNERIVDKVGIGWNYGPRPGTKYKVTYRQPLGIKDILFKVQPNSMYTLQPKAWN